jgi:hypothetical protein
MIGKRDCESITYFESRYGLVGYKRAYYAFRNKIYDWAIGR